MTLKSILTCAFSEDFLVTVAHSCSSGRQSPWNVVARDGTPRLDRWEPVCLAKGVLGLRGRAVCLVIRRQSERLLV